MANGEVRVGLIGAGRNTQARHIPGFQKVSGVEISAVANRSQESGAAGGRPVQHPRGLRQLAGAAGG